MRLNVKNTILRRKVLVNATILAAAFLLSACSLKDPAQSQIVIQTPQTNASSSRSIANVLQMPFLQYTTDLKPYSQMPQPTQRDNSPTPSQWGDLTCFAISVTGPGVPFNTNVSCPAGTTPPGLIAGMVPAGGTLVVQVPNGPSRLIQLMGFDSSVGCPDLPGLLTQAAQNNGNNNNNAFNGISNPYYLGQATVDVFSDVSVTIDATFDPTKALYNNCGVGNQGPSYSPTLAFTGFNAPGYFGPNVTASALPVSIPSPTSADFSSPQPIPSASIAALPGNGNSNSIPPVPQNPNILQAVTTNSNQSAVMRLVWNASEMNLAQFPYGQLNIVAAGGVAWNCIADQVLGVTGAIFKPGSGGTITGGEWIGLGQIVPGQGCDGNSEWCNFQGQTLNYPLKDFEVTGSDGNPYIIVDLESNYENNGGCMSAVYVAQAGLQLGTTPGFNGGSNNNLNAGAIGMQANYPAGGNNLRGSYVVEVSGKVLFSSNGGTPPYSYSACTYNISNGQCNGASTGSFADTTSGVFTASASSGAIDLITVTDSAGATQEFTVEAEAFGTNTGLMFLPNSAPSGSNPGYTAGSCVAMTVYSLGVNGAEATPVGGLSFYMNDNADSTGTSGWYSDSACTTAITSGAPLAMSSNISLPIYYKQTTAGMYTYSPNLNSSLPGQNWQVMTSVIPAAFYGVSLVGPEQVTEGDCVPYSFVTTDQYGNPTANTVNSPVNITLDPSGTAFPAGTWWSGAGCSGADLSANGAVSVNATTSGPASTTIYFKAPATTQTLSMSSTNVSVSGGSYAGLYDGAGIWPAGSSPTISAVVAGTGTHLKMVLDPGNPTPTSNSCIAVDLSLLDSAGNAATSGSSTIAIGGVNGPMSGPYASSGCTTQASSFTVSGNNVTKFYVQLNEMGNTVNTTLTALDTSLVTTGYNLGSTSLSFSW